MPNFRVNTLGNIYGDPTKLPVWGDDTGTYIIFGGYTPSQDRKLFRFCGPLPQQCCTATGQGDTNGGSPGFGRHPELKLYPNPAGSMVQVEYDLQGHRHAVARIWSSSGTLVKEVRLGSGFDFFQLDVSTLSSGTYIVTIETEAGIKLSEKFVKVGE